jgi:thiamine-monophosphate kinase
MTEFELIERVFRPLDSGRDDVALGIGDDAAVLQLPPGHELVACVDTLVAGVHFPADCSPFDIGWRAGASNLSDLAAMGAEPSWATLALTLPQADPHWLSAFAEGLAAVLRPWRVALVGGDTTRGPLTISLQAMGSVPAGQALPRSGARIGDLVYVSGTLGDAAAGLQLLAEPAPADGPIAFLHQRFLQPTPRLALGRALRGIASSCIDISDGLLADAGHLASASGVQLCLRAAAVPRSAGLLACFDADPALRLAATGGDDYELCFTLPPAHCAKLPPLARELDCPLTCIGVVREGSGLQLLDEDGAALVFDRSGYRHF